VNTKRFQDKVVLVTGGTSGIGRATALRFAQEGAKVVIAARRENLGNELVAEITRAGGEALFVKTDVTVLSQIDDLFKTIVERYGRLDCAFNNAGVGCSPKPVNQATMEEFAVVMNTNVRGLFYCMKQEIPIMVKQGGGAIVNTSAVAGIRAEEGIWLFTASKHAVLGITKAAAIECGRKKVRVNSICPGPVQTAILDTMWKPQEKALASVPMKRAATAEEVAGAVLFLCSDASSYVTGDGLVLGGGQSLHA
jgi:NAD(P)-dependent dehydrogenase (short-subunit alcohol dehydrogenase family)